jgi:prepilin-type N-terminal cleavage/methylation domain-containing protein
MLARLRAQQGFGMVEMIIAMVVLTVALLALAAAYDAAFFSLHSSARKSAAANLAEKQLELYSSMNNTANTGWYALIGLDTTRLATAKTDTNYLYDYNHLTPTGTDITISSCGSTANCLPLQTLTGTDGRTYKVETFVRDVTQTLVPSGSTTERVVTVVVRDPHQTGTPIVYEVSAAFDQGPR